MIEILKRNGKMGVKIENTDYGIELSTMRNGSHWSGGPVDVKLLEMIRDAINEYLEQK